MADRYERLVYINDIYYCENAPAILEAHALLKDSKENRIVAQLKFRNISGNVIKAVEICIVAKDSFGKEIEGITSFQYTDLNVHTNNTWGERQAITMPNSGVRSIQVAIKSVIFSDGTLWNAIGNPIAEKISKPLDLATVLKDKELIKQFRIEYGMNASNIYMQEKDIWHCVCGCINKLSLECCCACGGKKSKISGYSLELLQKNMQERCTKEAEELQKKYIEEQHQLAKEKQTMKRRVLLGACLSIVLILIAGVYYYRNIYLVESKYLEACKLYESGQFEVAQDAFKNLMDYKDSDNYIKEIEQHMYEEEQLNKYNEAKALEDEGKYDEAITKYEELGNYKDCDECIKRCNEGKLYQDIQNCIKLKKYKKALKLQQRVKKNYENELILSEWIIQIMDMDKEIYYYIGNDWYDKGDFDKAMQYYVECDGFGDSNKRIEKYNQVLKKKYKGLIGGYYKIGLDGKATYGTYIVIYVCDGKLVCDSEWDYGLDKEKMVKLLRERDTSVGGASRIIENKNGSFSEVSDDKKELYMEFKLSGNHDLIVYKTPLGKKYDGWKKTKGKYTFYSGLKY